jgi:hypothetical protein
MYFNYFRDSDFNGQMSSIKVIFQKLPASELDFQSKLKNVATTTIGPRELDSLQQHKIKRAAIGNGNLYDKTLCLKKKLPFQIMKC